ncbi:hypothetical protein GCM10009850_094440 [Nonomuraea monospora]|uniref:Uncharacterized protein n=1 Tax=Nonomuraea monospora TaxID=568818 RepID=A0ABP5PSX7_9ACTN
MIVTAAEDIERLLTGHRHFEECLLADVRWRHYGTTVELVFNSIWDGDRIRPDILARPRLVTVRLHLVQEFRLANAINEAVARDPESLDWGFSEVAMVSLAEEGPDHHRLAVLWEGDRRIDVVFRGLDIST